MPLNLSIAYTGSYAVPEIAAGIKAGALSLGHALSRSRADLYIMIRGGGIPPPHPNILILTDDPYEIDKSATISRDYDLVVTNERRTQSLHTNCIYRPFGYDAKYMQDPPTKFRYRAAHVGGKYPGREGWIAPCKEALGHALILIGHGWPQAQIRRRRVSYDEMIELYRDSAVILHPHRNNTYSALGKLNTRNVSATHLAPRIFDTAAAGCLQIIDRERDISILPHLLQADTPSEMIDMARYYSEPSHGAEAADLRRKQQNDVVKYSWANFLNSILEECAVRKVLCQPLK